MEEEKISFENSNRMRSRRWAVDQTLHVMAETQHQLNPALNIYDEIMKRERSHLNKAVFDMAEKNGISVYDICMQYMPKYGEPQIKYGENGVTYDQDMRLVPIPLELEKGPGYWKGKYYRLKEKLQELIDNKEDNV